MSQPTLTCLYAQQHQRHSSTKSLLPLDILPRESTAGTRALATECLKHTFDRDEFNTWASLRLAGSDFQAV